jgi:uncharacterized protein
VVSVIRRLVLVVTAPLAAAAAAGPGIDRLARRLSDAPRRAPEEAGMTFALDALGGEVVRLRSRDGIRLSARWLAAEPTPVDAHPGDPPAGEGAPEGGSAWVVDPREAILLLHGYSGSVTPDLLELGPFLRTTAGVLGLDFGGHGDSDPAPTTFGVREVEDVAGALAFLGERGVQRVAIVGSSMGGITAMASVAVLGDGRLDAADADPAATAAAVETPRPRIVAVVADSVPPELSTVIAGRLRVPLARVVAGRALARMGARAGGDPRRTQPIAVVALLEDMPLLLVHGERDRTVPLREWRRLAAAAPPATRTLVVAGADHAGCHAADPAAYEEAVTGLLRDAFAVARP